MFRRLFRGQGDGARQNTGGMRRALTMLAAETESGTLAELPELAYFYALVLELAEVAYRSPASLGDSLPPLRLDLRVDSETALSIGWRGWETLWVRHDPVDNPIELVDRLLEHFDEGGIPSAEVVRTLPQMQIEHPSLGLMDLRLEAARVADHLVARVRAAPAEEDSSAMSAATAETPDAEDAESGAGGGATA